MTKFQEQARIFRVLSVETRVRMIELLKSGPLCVKALARALSVTPAAVSQHLRVLRDAGAVRADKQGYFVHYRLDKTTLAKWGKLARDLLEAGEKGIVIPRLSPQCRHEDKSSKG